LQAPDRQANPLPQEAPSTTLDHEEEDNAGWQFKHGFDGAIAPSE
jgi:hypothetical protein